jgi:pimeloyl-ACP methyl ester carboxylesterase
MILRLIDRGDGIRLAARFRPGAGPVLVFLPGYASDMTGDKASALDQWAAAHDRAMLRLDYSGCGESEGAFLEGTLTRWRDDAALLIDHFAPDAPLVLIGSSMGGWIALMLAETLGPRVAALVGIAAAPDFTEWSFGPAERAALVDATLYRASPYMADPMAFTRPFWESGQASLMLDRPIAIDAPVRLLHGQCDESVPWQIAVRSVAALRSADVQVTLVKDGDHRLSRPQDLDLMVRTVASLGVSA